MTLQEQRKENSNKFIKELGIDCLETLPLVESSEQVKLKDIDTICKRIFASIISIQLACDIDQGNDYEASKEFFEGLLDRYGVKDCLLPNEKNLFANKYEKKDVLNVTWNYEATWSLLWALGLVEDMKTPFAVCDCDKAVTLVASSESIETFKSQAKLKDIEEILDMLDLYYRYHWAVVEKNINPNTNIGNLYPDVVWERRKGLEWLISNEEDWDEISLDT